LHVPTGRIYFSRDVIFQEDQFPFVQFPQPPKIQNPHVTPTHTFTVPVIHSPLQTTPSHHSSSYVSSPTPNNSLPLIHVSTPPTNISPTQSPPQIPNSSSLSSSSSNRSPSHLLSPSAPTNAPDILPEADASLPISSTHSTSVVIPSSNQHPMLTRSKNNITKPKKSFDGTSNHPLPHALLTVTALDEVEPTCHSTAIKHPKWREAMNAEFDALLKNQTWHLVPPSATQNIIGCKWVFRIKRKANGTIERYKARLVAKGFHQQPGVDYGETYSPVIKPTTVRTVLALAISAGWPIRQIDVNNAFLHGTISENVFMQQPPGFSHPQFPQHLCKLDKALYGLKQAPRAWFSRLSSRLIELGFHASKSDTSLFIFKSSGLTIFILIYVDDIIITSSKPSAIDDLITSLTHDFGIKDLGTLNLFLGIEVVGLSGGVLLSQQRFILDILKRTKMVDAKPVSSPMSSTTSLSAFDGVTFEDPMLYRSTVGALQYLCVTRPDIAFTVNKLSQFMHNPSITHWQSVKRLLRYLKQTITHGLQFSRSTSTQIQAFSDADWAGSRDDRRST
jgi:hypothetical protein